ncbi:MAG: NAD(P)/FAD-dependent oxidoreductase [Rhodothalassiaceae bacterium]
MTNASKQPAAPRHTDIAIIGGGIAGAAAGFFLARAGAAVLLIEAEAVPGYHTTGRSAAFFAESYGGPAVQPLSTASKAFLLTPPRGFAEAPLVTPRGAAHLYAAGQEGEAEARATALRAGGCDQVDLVPAHALGLDFLAPGRFAGALVDPDCLDMNVAALHQGFLRGMKASGGALRCGAGVAAIDRVTAGWRLRLADGAQIRVDLIVNAAGAWADDVARLAGAAPIGLTPLRRTIAVFEADRRLPADAPVILDLAESFYFKPEGAGVLTSPADETPAMATDVQPEELDIATGAARVEAATILHLRRLTAKWAGLRTFSPDRRPVIGFDPAMPGLFWSAGQGGWGIQTAPAWGDTVAAMILDQSPPVDPARFTPKRFA